MEEIMSKVLAAVLITVLAAVTFAAQEKKPAEKQTPKPKTTTVKLDRWEGIIREHDKNASTFIVRQRGKSLEKTVVYNNTTQWTKLNKGGADVNLGLFKEGERVIVLGKYDEKGRLVATRIDLRLQ
jgi:hypothetical protein